jgi:CubicO group peptidase (beta-lactamase class C family)
MRKILLSVVIGYLLIANAQAANPPLTPTIPEKVGFSSEALKRIDAFFDREIQAGRVPGAVIGIARDGKLVTLKAYGYRDKDKGLKMEVDSIFGLASMTKPQVAVGVLALTQRGLLPLNSPLAS